MDACRTARRPVEVGTRNGADSPSFAPAYAGTGSHCGHPAGIRGRDADAPTWRAAAAGDRHLLREPEGRRREDDLDAQPRRRARRAGQPRPVRRHGPAGQPDDEPGPEPGLDRALDVRRPRPPAPDPERDRAHGDRPGRLVDRPRRSGARALEHDRPRARPREGAERRSRRTTTTSSSTRRRRSAC